MITESLNVLKIHKVSKEQYNREFIAGTIDENAVYLKPDETADVPSCTEADNGKYLRIIDGMMMWAESTASPSSEIVYLLTSEDGMILDSDDLYITVEAY